MELVGEGEKHSTKPWIVLSKSLFFPHENASERNNIVTTKQKGVVPYETQENTTDAESY